MFVDTQKHQAKKLNDMQLRMQKDEVSYIGKINDDSQFQKAEAQKQAAHNAQMNEYEQFAKKKTKQNYKDMLDQQVNLKNQFKMYGNMSSMEKAMNRAELHAYKNNDNNQYSMIPGVTSTKAIPGLMNSPGIQKQA
jgi:hypothetical protein